MIVHVTTLVTYPEYVLITQDSTTPSATVNTQLDEALALIEAHCERRFENATYVGETSEVWFIDGLQYVYPHNTPITSVPSGQSYAVDVPYDARIVGVSLNAMSNSPVSNSLWWWGGDGSPYTDRERPYFATYTYTGGYTHDTLDERLRRAIVLIAQKLVTYNPSTPLGGQSVSVGDVSVTYPQTQDAIDYILPGASLLLKPFKRKRVRFA